MYYEEQQAAAATTAVVSVVVLWQMLWNPGDQWGESGGFVWNDN